MSAFPNEMIEIGYWNIRGLAAPLRMMAMYSGLQHKVAAYAIPDGSFDRSCWLGEPKAKLRQSNALINLPYVKDGDRVVTQSNACMSYLGRKTGCWGSNEDEIVACEQLLCEIYDVRGAVVRFSYPATPDAAPGFIADVRLGGLAKLALYLSRVEGFSQDAPFLVAGKATAPDFHLFEVLDQIRTACRVYGHCMSDDEFYAGELAPLRLFYNGFAALPNMQAYLNSPLHKQPFNNLMANFGSAEGGAKWIDGTTPIPPKCDGLIL